MYLFSVDVEDVRLQVPDGERYPPRVPEMTGRYLDFLRRHRGAGTFFVVGEVARAHPELIRRIVGEGHEIACHSDRHIPLNRQSAAEFRDDLCRNLEALRAAGAGEIRGYRAPLFSLTRRTEWAYPVLAELGFSYSSSVLPARHPLHGWPEFGREPRIVNGVVEMPITLFPSRFLPVPMGGGVYFRVLPAALLRRALRRRLSDGDAVLGYLHPYDIDAAQERFPHPGFSRGSPYNALMYANRSAVLGRLEMVAKLGFGIASYGSYAESLRVSLAPYPRNSDGRSVHIHTDREYRG